MSANLASRNKRSGGLREAKQYMTDKDIPQLFECMMTALMYKKPEDHFSFMHECIERAKTERQFNWQTFIDPLPPIPQKAGSIVSEHTHVNSDPSSSSSKKSNNQRQGSPLPPIPQTQKVQSNSNTRQQNQMKDGIGFFKTELMNDNRIVTPQQNADHVWYQEYLEKKFDLSDLLKKPIIFVLGGPGSGKGTQCEKIAKKYRYAHMSAGDLLRKEVASGTNIGKHIDAIITNGQLVPQAVTICLLKQAIVDHSTNAGFLVDGFPREVEQGVQFEKEVRKADLIIFYDCDDDKVLVSRLLARSKSSGRSDDNEETIRKRLELFHKKTKPVLDYFKSIVVWVDAKGSVENVFSATCEALDKMERESRTNFQTKVHVKKEPEIVLGSEEHVATKKSSPSKSTRRESENWIMEYTRRDIDVRPVLGKPIIFVLGGPGSGKGTQCERIVGKYKFTHLSAGDLLRHEVAKGTEIGSKLETIMKEGQLVPLDVTIALLKEAMVDAAVRSPGFVIDGFPREVQQGKQFEKQICLAKMVLYFNAPDEVLVSRLLSRALHSGRADDNMDTIKKRLQTYHANTSPIIHYYSDILTTIDANREIDEIFTDACRAIDYHVFGISWLKQPVIFLLGLPFSGKNTQSRKLAEKYGFFQISAKRLLQSEIESGSPSADRISASLNGETLYPQDVILDLLKKSMMENSQSKGFIIDGFPQDQNQLYQFEAEIGPAKMMLFYDCSGEVAMEWQRLKAREEGLSIVDADIGRRRMERFHSVITQLLLTCGDRITSIDCNGSVDDVFTRSCRAIDEVLTDSTEQQSIADDVRTTSVKGVHISEKPVMEVVQEPCQVVGSYRLGDAGNTQAFYEEVLRDKRVIFVVGGPGCGKGTQCVRIAERYGYAHLSTGDILRAEVASGSERGEMVSEIIKEGQLVPQHIVLECLADAMARLETARCFLVDGFPRELQQAIDFENTCKRVDMVLYFSCPSDVMLRRIMGRAAASGRADDTAETAMRRIETFDDRTMPVVNYYQKKGKLKEVAAVAGVEEVFAQVCKILDQFELETAMAEELRKKNIIFVLGGPGCGKGTQCEKIVSRYGYCHLSTGDLLRDEVKKVTPRAEMLKEIMAKGELVSQDTMLELLRDAMLANADATGFLIDGFPRDIAQGEEFERKIGSCMVILYFECPNEVMVERLLHRAKTSGRVDDNEETIKKRLKTFEDQTLPVLDKYAGKVKKIDATRHVDPIFSDVCTVLDNL